MPSPPRNSLDSSPLPFEMISEIFFHCLPNVRTVPDKSEAPLLLGRICKEWREIALTTPSLWTTFVVHWTHVSGTVHLASLWLSRARGYPLSIQIHDPEGSDTHTRRAFLKTICRYASQWRDVELSLPLDVLSHLRIEGPLPLLERLVIGSEASIPENGRETTVFRDAPLLRELHLTLDITGIAQPRTIALPWERLTSFTGCLFTNEEWLYVLSHASSLVECKFHHCIGGQQDLDVLAPLPLLKRLTLEGNSYRKLTGVLHFLTLPALDFLELREEKVSWEQDMESPLRTTLSFLTRSSCPLRELRLTAYNISPELLSQCLRTIPALEILEIAQLTHEIFAVLRLLHASSNLLPRLQSFNTHPASGAPIPYDDLIAMLFSRSSAKNGGAVRLERFKFTFAVLHTPCPEASVLDRFKVLVGKGMEIHLGPPDISWVN
ncbi:hypothetical protein DFH07DRAFT_537757 [Mycena maculata]|uniref:F-box domain-containing protein n=1 Tax=Mycena maculata TaxID=230809 RepID=A0AAD7K5R8_9AGAR|nr:hypothetical protein DFH07DRAFT_537757 [Mycena maculata]